MKISIDCRECKVKMNRDIENFDKKINIKKAI